MKYIERPLIIQGLKVQIKNQFLFIFKVWYKIMGSY